MLLKLNAFEFDSGAPGPHLLITGGVHGDEFEPPLAIRRLIERFRDADNGTPLLCGRLTLVPIVNEAAFLRGRRTAEDELDLARVCPGQPDGLITEQTAFALSELIRTANCYIDLHSGGTAFSVLPLSGYVLHPVQQILDQQRRMAEAFNFPILWGTSAELEGRSLSVARDAGIPAIYAEYHGAGQSDPQGVRAYEESCLNVLAHLGMIAERRGESAIRYRVEDTRPQSGHMQLCYPSPISGLFEPHVALGDFVKPGDLLGEVWNPTTLETHSITSTQAGIVLTLRTFNRVLKGDSVGVVLEVPVRAE